MTRDEAEENEVMKVNPADIMCSDRYPMCDLEQPAFQRLCKRARTALDTQSVLVLPDFVRPKALEQMRHEANALAPLAHHMDVVTTLYPERPEDEDLPAHHVRRRRFHTSVRAISYPNIPWDSTLRVLYEWDPLTLFIAALLGVDNLYRYDDPYGALNIAVMAHGDEFGWHFDQTDFVVTLVLQEPEGGGDFLCCHAIRSEEDDNDTAIQAVIDNRSDAVSTVPMKAGSFMLFRGRHALHQVTPIQGRVPRLVALLAYDTKPGTVSSPGLLQARYGIAIHNSA